MARVLVKFAAAVLALGALGGAAEAQQIDVRITASDRAYTTVGSHSDVISEEEALRHGRYVAPRQPAFDDDWRYGSRHNSGRRHSGYDYREQGRYYGRPVPERGSWDRHGYGRPVAVQPSWGRRHDCRVIVKQRVNEWGRVVITQKEVCR